VLAKGDDPKPGRHATASNAPESRSMAVAELCDRYMEAARAGLVLTRFNRPKKASTLAIDVGRIERHIKPLIGTLPVTDVTGAVVRRLAADVAAGKTIADVKTGFRGRARVTGGPGTVARVVDLLSGIMAWAQEQELVERNPVHGVKRYRGEPRDRFLSVPELGRLGAVLRRSGDDPDAPFNPSALSIVTLLLLTGCRGGEIEGLRWSEVDAENRCLWLADTKTGKSMRPLGAAAFAALDDLPRLGDSPYVFPAYRGDGHYLGTKREVPRIMSAAGIENAGRHSLRHTFASVASDLGFSDAIIGGLSGHKGRGVTSRYIHRPDTALIMAADRVSERMSELLSPITE